MTRTIAMSEKELNRKTIIEQAEEKRITQKEAASRLGISERHFRRILARYRQMGASGLVSGHRGKPGNRRLKQSTQARIETFIQDPIFHGFGPTLLREKLKEYTKIEICKETMRQIMIEEGIHKPKTKKKRKIHLQRERRKHRGELVQIDGSYHAWLEERGPKACLLLFVDDATSEILAARFVEHESFFTYGQLCKSYFRSVGVPDAFYSDKFSVFRVNSGNKDSITQFARALSALGIELICANSPQAKGRVERANETLQDRLVKDLRLEKINDYQEANAFLPVFIQSYNRQFAVLPRSTRDFHNQLDQSLDLDFLFAVHDTRLIAKDLTFQFNNITYQIVTNRPPQNLIGREVLVTQVENGEISAYLNSQLLSLKIIQKQPKQAQIVSSKSLDHRIYVPPVNHPWRSYRKKLNGNPVLEIDG